MKILSNGPGDVYFKEKLCSQSWGGNKLSGYILPGLSV